MNGNAALPRLALLCDMREEGWPSMDLAAEALGARLREDHAASLRTELVRPALRRRLGRLPFLGSRRAAFNADRLLGRFWDYPRALARRVADFDLFHVCDHSYAQLVHGLPRERTGVFCHDLDAFRSLLEPEREPRPRWFRALARRVLAGLEKAAVVFHSTHDVRRSIERAAIVDPARLVHAPYGVAAEFTPAAEPRGGAPFVLHVGSCIPRKRIDLLLDVFAAVRARAKDLRLVQVGGEWTDEQRARIDWLGIDGAVEQLRGLERGELARLYRGTAAVLLPSEREGFGFPVVEGLACGAIVVASDIPVLREVGGDGAVYCPAGDRNAWSDTVARLVAGEGSAPELARRLAWAQRFTWEEHARVVARAYLALPG